MATNTIEAAIPADAMRIAVIGAGNIGRTLGAKWATAGHQVIYGVRTPEAPDTAPIADAVASAEVVVLAVPGAAAKDVLGRRGEDIAAEYLTEHGLVVLDRNWRCRHGELDIVCTDSERLVVCGSKGPNKIPDGSNVRSAMGVLVLNGPISVPAPVVGSILIRLRPELFPVEP